MMKKRSFARVVNTALLRGILLIIIGGTAMVQAQGKNGSTALEGSMVTADKTESLAIPPIDAAAPTTFETASFGLG